MYTTDCITTECSVRALYKGTYSERLVRPYLKKFDEGKEKFTVQEIKYAMRNFSGVLRKTF